MKNANINTVLLIVSILALAVWLASIRMRENLKGDSKAVAYVRDADRKKFINPYIAVSYTHLTLPTILLV